MKYDIATNKRILAVGKIRRKWILDGINLYLKRLPNLKILEIKDSNSLKEARDIRSALYHNELIVVLMEKGETLSSVSFAKKLDQFGKKRIAFVIGGADGLTKEIMLSAYWRLSLSSMTFTHELARLILVEQLFRAQSIIQGNPYHRF